jgi:hypothetical protein
MIFVSTGFEASANLASNLQQSVPLPFGYTSLQKPTITSVSPTCVDSGDTFLINGTGLYPSTVTSIVVGGIKSIYARERYHDLGVRATYRGRVRSSWG